MFIVFLSTLHVLLYELFSANLSLRKSFLYLIGLLLHLIAAFPYDHSQLLRVVVLLKRFYLFHYSCECCTSFLVGRCEGIVLLHRFR